MKSASLPKAERLRSQKQIAALMCKGTALFHFPFKVSFSFFPAVAGVPCCRVAVNVPKRNFKKAVTRNLLKRRMREAFRINKQELYETLAGKNKAMIVFFHYVSPEILQYADIESHLRNILETLAGAAVKGDSIPVDTRG
ncbi:MAG: ribonuclease P protein component [Prevotellaceae bacterium]|jgi:ribonuclease P protein component|nr:ribonuclease P protein component [Prevotellaceae bacterium]